MFEKVLLPTDFSGDAQKLLACLGDIPGLKEVILLHVVDATHPPKGGLTHDQQIENARILMAENKAFLENLGLTVQTKIDVIVSVITQGDVPLAILETAQNENVSLIMMGARGKNPIRSILLGSVSASVIHRATTNVLLMRYPPGKGTGEKSCARIFSRVLVPTDFSKPAGDAVALLQELPASGEVVLFHVVDKGESEKEIEGHVKAAQEKLERLRGEFVRAGFNAISRVHVGYAPDEIIATADIEDVSVIVMSPYGEGWVRDLKALFMGSTTGAVVRRAQRPVLIVKDKKTA
ncbi:MAG: universal stress protein [Methanoregula sp.]|nr:MAG: universal stress protein [Methanoregula sp.]